MNLITDPWIPARRPDGSRGLLRPVEALCDPGGVRIASTRPEFDAELVSFLVGAVYVAMPPRDEMGWWARFQVPPTQSEIDDRFARVSSAFDLFGDCRYQQFHGPSSESPDSTGATRRADRLMVGRMAQPGRDVFGRQLGSGALCLPCSAIALTTIQSVAPVGGRGIRASLRGGGPLTTLVVCQNWSLWQTVWANVMPIPFGIPALGQVFAWLGELPQRVEVSGADPRHALFASPRRIWLDDPVPGRCSECDQRGDVVHGYTESPHGLSYCDGWRHPLSPYRRFQGDRWLAIKSSGSRVDYDSWLDVTLGTDDTSPAFAATAAYGRGLDAELWCFGFDMHQARADSWCESRVPLHAGVLAPRP